MTDLKQGYVPNEVYKVEQFGNSFKLIDTQGVKVGTMGVPLQLTERTFSNKERIFRTYITKNGKKIYKKVDMDVYNTFSYPNEHTRWWSSV